VKHAATSIERQLEYTVPHPDRRQELHQITRRLIELRAELEALNSGRAPRGHTPLRQAAQELATISSQRATAERVLTDPYLGWRARAFWRREAADLRARESAAAGLWTDLATSNRAELSREIDDLRGRRDDLFAAGVSMSDDHRLDRDVRRGVEAVLVEPRHADAHALELDHGADIGM
jgi:hypothetical protein